LHHSSDEEDSDEIVRVAVADVPVPEVTMNSEVTLDQLDKVGYCLS
jgi:hypothetical protein